MRPVIVLTPRQAEVATLVAKGKSDKGIGKALGISTETVRKHIAEGAERVPVTGKPRYRLLVWFFTLRDKGM